MVLSSIDFIIFFAVLLSLLHFFQRYGERRKKDLLIAASYFFYGYWDVKALLLVVGVTLGNYFLGGLVARESFRKKWVLWVSILFNLSILGFFKYYNFFIESLGVFLPVDSQPFRALDVILPVGISFYIFQAMTYPIDIYQKRIGPASLRDVALYIAFFPKITVGPIATAAKFIPQLARPIILSKENLAAGSSLFILGLVKKSVLADSLTLFVDEVFKHPALYDAWSTLASVVAYSMQIYCDFSGYSDMAIGTAMILGFSLPLNFNYPYKSTSVTDFWRRWHISLSTWLRDYLYIPLGGSRKGKIRTYINIFITFFLCGLWHGAGLTYILWGSYHGIGLIVHKLWMSRPRQVPEMDSGRIKSIYAKCWPVVGTYIFVTVGWILFRSASINDAGVILMRIIRGVDGVSWIHISFWLIAPVFFCWHLSPGQDIIKKKFMRFDTLIGLSVIIGLVVLVLLFSPLGSSPFIYFQF